MEGGPKGVREERGGRRRRKKKKIHGGWRMEKEAPAAQKANVSIIVFLQRTCSGGGMNLSEVWEDPYLGALKPSSGG